MTAFIQNKRIGRSVNILGYDPLWKDVSQARMHDKHFQLIKQAGFDSVRINMHPFKHMVDRPPYQIEAGWLDKLDWAVTQALDNALNVILDLHEFHAMAKAPEHYLPRLLAFWTQLSSIYQSASDAVLYEILNEPFDKLTSDMWNQFLKQAHATIREIDTQRTIIIGPGHWNSIFHLDTLILPDDDNQIITTVHYYHPMNFTHQGAPWADYMDATGTEWHGTTEEQQSIIEDFSKAQTWSKAHNRPLFLGEFGAYDKADIASRVRYTDFVARLAEKLDWSWAYWQFDSDFVVFNIDNDRWNEPIRDALIP